MQLQDLGTTQRSVKYHNLGDLTGVIVVGDAGPKNDSASTRNCRHCFCRTLHAINPDRPIIANVLKDASVPFAVIDTGHSKAVTILAAPKASRAPLAVGPEAAVDTFTNRCRASADRDVKLVERQGARISHAAQKRTVSSFWRL